MCVKFSRLLLAAICARQGDIFDQWSDLDVRGDYEHFNFIVVDTRRNVVPNVLLSPVHRHASYWRLSLNVLQTKRDYFDPATIAGVRTKSSNAMHFGNFARYVIFCVLVYN